VKRKLEKEESLLVIQEEKRKNKEYKEKIKTNKSLEKEPKQLNKDVMKNPSTSMIPIH